METIWVFPIMNPITNTPIFMGLVANTDNDETGENGITVLGKLIGLILAVIEGIKLAFNIAGTA